MKPKRSASRTARTLWSLIFISLLGVGVAFYNAYTARRDAALATGPQSESQRQFFIQASERPDLAVFFKSLSHRQRVEMADNVGRYQDAALAKLIGTCLADFDSQARTELTKSLANIAKVHPDAVAEQLKLGGSFQQLGVQSALKTTGAAAVPVVVKQLTVADARNNAVSFLVDLGDPSVPALIDSLRSDNADVRKAAADALGKIANPQAVEPLTAKYDSSSGDEQIAYLAALSAVGDPRSQSLFVSNLDDETYPLTRRALAGIGLGRIGSPLATEKLWKYADHPDLDFRSQIVSALQLAGDAALRSPDAKPAMIFLVAQHIDTPLATQILRNGLEGQRSIGAVRAADNRPELVPPLVSLLQTTDPNAQGDLVDAIVQSLTTTDQGRKQLERFRNNPLYAGFIVRRERLAG